MQWAMAGTDRTEAMVSGGMMLRLRFFTAFLLFIEFNAADSRVIKPEPNTRPRLGQKVATLADDSKALQADDSKALQADDSKALQAGSYPPGAHRQYARNYVPESDNGGTACQCVCGDRVVWNREVFKGDVAAQKEYECEHKVCPKVTVPGLKVQAKCSYVKDMSELTAGTICNCQCGDKIVWRNRAFYGNV